MPTAFSKFVFENRNGVSVKLTLEAPVGTPIIQTDVAAQSSVTLNPNVNDIRGARIRVVALGHEDYPDTETFELGGSPYLMYFEILNAHAAIGSIHGVVSAAF
jgi:hypothetical protein